MTNNISRPSISNSKLASVLIVTSALLIGCLSILTVYGLSENAPVYIRKYLLLMIDHLRTGLSNSLHNIDMIKEKVDCAFSSSRKDYCDHQIVRDHLDLLDSLGLLSNVLFLPLLFIYCIKRYKPQAAIEPEQPCACAICKSKPTCVPELKCDLGSKCVPEPTCYPESIRNAELTCDPWPKCDEEPTCDPESKRNAELTCDLRPKCDAEPTCDPRPKCDAEPTFDPESKCNGNPACDTNIHISTCDPEPKCDLDPICDPEPKCDPESICDPEPKCDAETKGDAELTCDIETIGDLEPTCDSETTCEANQKAVALKSASPVSSTHFIRPECAPNPAFAFANNVFGHFKL